MELKPVGRALMLVVMLTLVVAILALFGEGGPLVLGNIHASRDWLTFSGVAGIMAHTRGLGR